MCCAGYGTRHQFGFATAKVRLVLAGGGARGASFIGVLKYLEELDIPIDSGVVLGARYDTVEVAALLFSIGL